MIPFPKTKLHLPTPTSPCAEKTQRVKKSSGSLDLPKSGSTKYRVARNMVPARSWSPPPKKNPELLPVLSEGTQHAAIPGRPRCSGRPKFSSIQ